MKNIFTCIALGFILIISSVSAGNSPNKSSKIDPATRQMLRTAGTSQIASSGESINVLMKISDSFDRAKAESSGVRFGTTAGKILTACVPVSYLQTLASADGVIYIDGAKISHPQLDSARAYTGVDKIQSGAGLSKSLTGKGVVVGIIDAGFDYTHPAFRDAAGNLRIKRVWEQFRAGNPPAGYSYGNNLSNPAEITAASHDLNAFSHGTHVAGIAAGSSVSGAETYHGVAPDADIVIVALNPPAQDEWKNASLGDMIDGINYIFRYADSVGKPAVVNLSWGGQIGPHDGSSLFSQALEALVGSGKIFCVSAGNDGDTKLHIRKTFTSASDTLRTFVLQQYDKTAAKNGIWLDLWGEKGKDFSASFGIYNIATKSDLYSSGFISSSSDSVVEYKYISGKDTCDIAIYYEICTYNGKPHAFAAFSGNKAFRISLSAAAPAGTLDAWNWYLVDYRGITSNFSSLSNPNASAGDSSITISDLATSPNAIAVGAFVTKNNYTAFGGVEHAYNYEIGKRAYFTSLGPSANGRTKPDISSPGMMLCSSINDYDSTYFANGIYRSQVALALPADAAETAPETLYAMMSGTSMSSPFTTGTVALLLEANPKLTPAQIIALFSATADTSLISGNSLPDAVYGPGKLNSFAAALRVLAGDGVESNIAKSSVYPNPFFGSFTIEDEIPAESEAILFSADGRAVKSMKSIGEKIRFEGLSQLPAGAYYLVIYQGNRIVSAAKCLHFN